MTPGRILRMAWAGTLVAAATAFLFLAYAPIPSSYIVDRLLTASAAVVGVVIGAALEIRIEEAIRARREEAAPSRARSDPERVSTFAARGA